MNKKIPSRSLGIILIIGILLVGTVIAVSFNSREELLDYFTSYKQQRESEINKLILTITYTSDKVCKIDYNSEKIYCEVCFSYVGDDDAEECMTVSEESSVNEIDVLVKEFVRNELRQTYPIEEMEYTKENMDNRKITIK